MKRNIWIGLTTLPLVLAGTARGADLGTAFTYQGSLENPPGQVVNDICTFEFTLCDDATAACVPGTVSSHLGVAVMFGVFTVPDVDFGDEAFTGEARWMEIGVKCSDDVSFVILSPRVELKPAPYALALPGLYTQQNPTSPNIIGGYNGNAVTASVIGATIAGGGGPGQPNQVSEAFGTVGGGLGNSVTALGATVSGGVANSAGGSNATVAGGGNNIASGPSAFVGGGDQNTASGTDSFASGNRAKAIHDGTFVWADATAADFTSTGANQFLIRAAGNVGIGTANPTQKLDVAGTIASTGLSVPSGTVALPSNQIDSAEVSFGYAGSSSKGGAALDVVCASCITLGSETSGSYDSTPDTIGDDGVITSSEVGFNYAGSTSKGGSASDVACTNCILLGTETSGSYDSTPDTIADDGQISDAEASDFLSINNGLLYAPVANSNVGVRTTSPNEALEVNGNIRISSTNTLQLLGPAETIRYSNGSLVGDQGMLFTAHGTRSFVFGTYDGSTYSGNRMVVTGAGNVGIGRTPSSNKLEVEGDASKTTAGSWVSNSDAAIKTDVRTVTDALSMIARLRPVAFRYTEDYKAKHPSVKDQDYYNYIAQEFREVFPEWVQDSGEDGLLQMDSYPTGVYAVAAIQELHQIVQEKDCEIEELGSEISNLKSEISEIRGMMKAFSAAQNGGAK